MGKVDPVLEAIGGRGRYQVLQYFISTLASLSAAFQLLNFVFVGRKVPHVCQQPANLSDVYQAVNIDFINENNSIVVFDKCKITIQANISGVPYISDLPCLYGYQYEEKKDSSLMSDMDIVCDRAPLRALGQTLLIMGQGIGALTLPVFSDRYGRRTVLLISHTIFLGLGVAIAFPPSFTVFLALRVFLGIVQKGIVTSKSIISIEMFSTKYRKFAGLLGSLIWTACSCLIPLVAYLIESYSWRSKVPICICFLDESLSWLITNRKWKQVEKNLMKAAGVSGKDESEVIQVYKRYQDEEEGYHPSLPAEDGIHKAGKTKDETKPSFLDLMKRKRLAVTVFILCFTWLTDSMIFFGLYMTSHTLAGNRYVNFFLYSIVFAPAVFVFFWWTGMAGRRRVQCSMVLVEAGFS